MRIQVVATECVGLLSFDRSRDFGVHAPGCLEASGSAETVRWGWSALDIDMLKEIQFHTLQASQGGVSGR